MSLPDTGQLLGELGVQRSHVAVHNWVHKAELQPISTLSADQFAVDEKMIRLHGKEFRLSGAVDPKTNEIIALELYPTTTKVTTRWFLDQLHRRCNLAEVTILVDDATYLTEVLADDGYRFRYEPDGNPNSIERVFREVERRTSSFSNIFSHVELATAQSWLETFAVYHNSR
jgi:putative transposase